MRKAIVALSTVAVALGALAVVGTASAKEPKKSMFGCVVGKERWDASQGKCVPAHPVKHAHHHMSHAKKAPPKAN